MHARNSERLASPTRRRATSPSAINKRLPARFALHLLLSALAFTMALPFIWMVLTSLKSVEDINEPGWMPTLLNFGNYLEVFEVISFARFYWNSIFIACWITFLQVLTSSLAAYSFSRLHWPGRDTCFLLYLGTMMLPALVMIIPNYQIMVSLGLVDTFVGLVLPAAFSPFGTFLLRQFMLGIPESLDEAAKIDGANHWTVFWDIIMPLTRPGLIALTIFTFVAAFQNFFWPLVMLRSVHNYTLPVGLLYFDSIRGQSTHLLMAAVTLSVVPMVTVFVTLQRHLVEGIQAGSIKG